MRALPQEHSTNLFTSIFAGIGRGANLLTTGEAVCIVRFNSDYIISGFSQRLAARWDRATRSYGRSAISPASPATYCASGNTHAGRGHPKRTKERSRVPCIFAGQSRSRGLSLSGASAVLAPLQLHVRGSLRCPGKASLKMPPFPYRCGLME
jgi:hypothetical protein